MLSIKDRMGRNIPVTLRVCARTSMLRIWARTIVRRVWACPVILMARIGVIHGSVIEVETARIEQGCLS